MVLCKRALARGENEAQAWRKSQVRRCAAPLPLPHLPEKTSEHREGQLEFRSDWSKRKNRHSRFSLSPPLSIVFDWFADCPLRQMWRHPCEAPSAGNGSWSVLASSKIQHKVRKVAAWMEASRKPKTFLPLPAPMLSSQQSIKAQTAPSHGTSKTNTRWGDSPLYDF